MAACHLSHALLHVPLNCQTNHERSKELRTFLISHLISYVSEQSQSTSSDEQKVLLTSHQPADMTNQILEVLEQRPLNLPQCKAPELQPSHLPTSAPVVETATPMSLQYDVQHGSPAQQAQDMNRSAAVISALNHTNAALANGDTSWQDHDNETQIV